MIGSCMELHVVTNWMVTYYKISSSAFCFDLGYKQASLGGTRKPL